MLPTWTGTQDLIYLGDRSFTESLQDAVGWEGCQQCSALTSCGSSLPGPTTKWRGTLTWAAPKMIPSDPQFHALMPLLECELDLVMHCWIESIKGDKMFIITVLCIRSPWLIYLLSILQYKCIKWLCRTLKLIQCSSISQFLKRRIQC